MNDKEWPDEVEEVAAEPKRRGAQAPPVPRNETEPPSRDKAFNNVIRQLFISLNQSRFLPVSDGVTAHMVIAEALIRDADGLRVLYQENVAAEEGTFLEAGRNAAGVRAARHVHSPNSNIWSVTVDELCRVLGDVVVGDFVSKHKFDANSEPGGWPAWTIALHLHGDFDFPDGDKVKPFSRLRPTYWHLRHDVRADGVRAFAYGPDCSFQLTLDIGFVGARVERGVMRWDVRGDDGGYSLCCQAMEIPDAAFESGLSDLEIMNSWHRSRANHYLQNGYPRAAEGRVAWKDWLLSFRPLIISVYPGVPDLDDRRPGYDTYHVCGGPPTCPDWFSHEPIEVSEELAIATIIQRPHMLVLALRGHGGGWTREALVNRVQRLAHTVLPLSL